MNDLGQYIRLKRIEKGMSQRSLARAVGLSSGAVSMIERGDRTDLRAETAKKLACGLGVEASELLDRLDIPA